ncbi:MAG: class I SAM-dependent methyltransferase [Xenococcaceae cyanobacterium MO_188.B29]|nr:class I SAM-dependent methyltransferase [Xenococcaceae cyanobacterium MO_188.B29]
MTNITNNYYPNSYALQKIIGDRLATTPENRITFAEYMNLVLYHPQYGYYSSGIVEIGSTGDFFTSSSLGEDFGQLLASQWWDIWQTMNCTVPFSIVEMGGGNGRTAYDILKYLQTFYPDFSQVIEYILIEESPELIQVQQETLKSLEEINITWKTWQEIPDDSVVGCFFSNELVDALPVHLVSVKNSKLQEIYLTREEEKIIETYGEISTPKLQDYFDFVEIDLLTKDYPEDYRTEVNLAALDWLSTVANKLHKGYIFTIDYGYPASKYYHPQRYEGTLKCYYQHRHHNNPYVNLGYQDITAHVDFTALEKQGELCGLEKIGFTQQGMLLMALGLGDRLNQLSSGKYDIQEVFRRRDALHQLIDPTGLGGFGVLIQGKQLQQQEKLLKGLTIPPMA